MSRVITITLTSEQFTALGEAIALANSGDAPRERSRRYAWEKISRAWHAKAKASHQRRIPIFKTPPGERK